MKEPQDIAFFRLSEQGLLIQWPNQVSAAILREVSALTKAIETEFKGVFCTPTYASILAVFPVPISNIAAIELKIKELFAALKPTEFKAKHIEIPVCYAAEFAPDQEMVCEQLNMDFEEIVKRHCLTNYLIYGIGFLPGFMYLGGLDPHLEMPRKETPRMKVPKGAVGIAAKQTGVYPHESPGGWNLIGNCPIDFFKPDQKPPFFAQVGDQISFVPISKDEYKLIKIAQETGVYTLKTKPL